MAITAQTPRNVSTAAAGATVFPYSFKIVAKGDLLVQVTSNDVTQTKVVDVDYTVSGVGEDAGGNVTFTVPLVGGEIVLRKRSMVFQRLDDYQNLGDLRSPTLNNDQDAPVMMVQQLADAQARSLQISDQVSGFNPFLPYPMTPGDFLMVGADGLHIALGSTVGSGDLLLRPEIASQTDNLFQQPGTGASLRGLVTKLRERATPQDFGAIGDGTSHPLSERFATLAAAQLVYPHALALTDEIDWAAVQAAINFCQATNRTLFVPVGIYQINHELRVTSGFKIQGDGHGDNTVTSTQPVYPCGFRWTGSTVSTEYILRVQSETDGNFVWGFHLDGVALMGANAAYGGLKMSSTRASQLGTVWVDRCRGVHVLYNDDNNALSAFNSIYQLFMVAGSAVETAAAVGLKISSQVGRPGCTQMRAFSIFGTTQIGTNTIDIGDIDSSWFGHVQASRLRFRGLSDGQPRPSRKNMVCWFAGGSVIAETNSRNIIEWVNSEGTDVTVQAGGSLHYSVIDRTNGRRFSSHAQVIDSKIDLPLSEAFVTAGAPDRFAAGSAGYSGLRFQDAVDSSVSWSFRMPRAWHMGKITGFELLVYNPAGTAGAVRLGLSVGARALGSTLATAMTETISSPAIAGSATTQLLTVSLSTYFEVGSNAGGNEDYLIGVELKRYGTGGTDTLAGSLIVLAIRPLYQTNVANTDSPDYRYNASPDHN